MGAVPKPKSENQDEIKLLPVVTNHSKKLLRTKSHPHPHPQLIHLDATEQYQILFEPFYIISYVIYFLLLFILLRNISISTAIKIITTFFQK